MTIYILDNDPVKCASYLDDKSLDRQIKSIAQVLCNVHHYQSFFKGNGDYANGVPLISSDKQDLQKWSHWARECPENYGYLCELGTACCNEWQYRFSTLHKNEKVIHWAIENSPEI